jgi:hypothetical protein
MLLLLLLPLLLSPAALPRLLDCLRLLGMIFSSRVCVELNELPCPVQGEINNLAPLRFPFSLCNFFNCLEIYMMCGAAVNEKVFDPRVI